MIFQFSDLKNDDTDSGFGDFSVSDPLLDNIADWIPPLNRKRHPAGDGKFCSPPSMPIPQRDPSLPSPALSVFTESQLFTPSTPGSHYCTIDDNAGDDWVPPTDRKRHPAGNEGFCSPDPPKAPPKRDPSLRPTRFSFPPETEVLRAEFHPSLPGESISRSPNQIDFLHQSSSGCKTDKSFIFGRFFNDGMDNGDSGCSSDNS